MPDILDTAALRALIEEAVVAGVRRALGAEHQLPRSSESYLTVAHAAKYAAVAPATIRAWMDTGRLGRYKAGRVLRVKRSELETFLASSAGELRSNPGERPPTPEELADRDFERRRARLAAAKVTRRRK